jgi:hypothetical protein
MHPRIVSNRHPKEHPASGIRRRGRIKRRKNFIRPKVESNPTKNSNVSNIREKNESKTEIVCIVCIVVERVQKQRNNTQMSLKPYRNVSRRKSSSNP